MLFRFLPLLLLLSSIPPSLAQKVECFSNPEQINDIHIDEDKLWLATNGGLLICNKEGQTLKKYTPLDGFAKLSISTVFKAVGNEMIAETDNRLYRLVDEHWVAEQNYKGLGLEIELSKQRAGLWLIGEKKMLYINNDGTETFFPSPLSNKAFKGKNLYDYKALLDSKGRVWIANHNKLWCLEKNKWTAYAETRNEQVFEQAGTIYCLKENYAMTFEKGKWKQSDDGIWDIVADGTSFYQDGKNQIWFLDKNRTIFSSFSGQQIKKHHYPISKLVGPSPVPSCHREDPEGNLWIGTYLGILYKFKAGKWETFQVNSPQFSNGAAVLRADKNGDIWLANGEQLNHYDGQNWEAISSTDWRITNAGESTLILDDRNQIWLEAKNGLLQYMDGKWLRWCYESDLTFMAASKGNVVALSQDNILHTFHSNGKINYEAIPKSMGKELWRYRTRHYDGAGNMWFYNQDSGLILFDGVAKTYLTAANCPLQDFEYTVSIQGDVTGNVWFEETEQICSYADGEWKSFSSKNSPVVKNSQLLIDNEKKAWLFSNKKLYQYNYSNNRWEILKSSKFPKELDQIRKIQMGRDGSKWLLSRDALWQISTEGQLSKIWTLKLGYIELEHLAEDINGDIWITTSHNGIYKYSSKSN